MKYKAHYDSPLGRILLAADDLGLTGLWFVGQKYFARGLNEDCEERDVSAFAYARKWMDCYFSGSIPEEAPPLHLQGTEFQREVWDILCGIPYGETVTYGDIARKLALRWGVKSMSAQAVGGAVGHNPVSIIVPCHRVLGSSGSLTGYAGGLDRKMALLELEKR